ncbi:hypothetical protein CHS0354_015105, partial [Potamilus streckersoni]
KSKSILQTIPALFILFPKRLWLHDMRSMVNCQITLKTRKYCCWKEVFLGSYNSSGNGVYMNEAALNLTTVQDGFWV